MKLCVISDVHDTHGFANVLRMLDKEQPELLLGCGDFGKIEERAYIKIKHPSEIYAMTEIELARLWNPILDRIRLYICYGNHDEIDVLRTLRNRDNTEVLLTNNGIAVNGLSIYGFSGIHGTRKKHPWYFSWDDLPDISDIHPIDILLTHDIWNPQSLISEVVSKLRPRFHFHGHIHRQSITRHQYGHSICTGSILHEEYAVLENNNAILCQL